MWILKRPPRFRERERARDRISSLSFFSSLGICTFCISIWSEREKKVRARARFFFDFSASSDDDENPVPFTEIGTISERNNEVALVLSSSFFFLSSFLRGCHFICEKTLFEFSLLRFLQVKQRRRRCRRITRANVNCGKS